MRKLGMRMVGWAVKGATAAGAVQTAAVVALKGIGFGSVGPAAGSYAAAWMSSIATASGTGGVAAGSLYAFLQSTAMTTALVNPVAAVVSLGAAVYHVTPKVRRAYTSRRGVSSEANTVDELSGLASLTQ